MSRLHFLSIYANQGGKLWQHTLSEGFFPFIKAWNFTWVGSRCGLLFKYCDNAAAAAKSLQSCLTLCDPMDCSLPGFSVSGILQARTLEWVAISFSNAWKWKVKSFSRVRLLVTPWTAAYQAPPSVGFSKQEYWSGVPLPSPSFICLKYNLELLNNMQIVCCCIRWYENF